MSHLNAVLGHSNRLENKWEQISSMRWNKPAALEHLKQKQGETWETGVSWLPGGDEREEQLSPPAHGPELAGNS